MRNLILVCCCLALGLTALSGCNKTADQSAQTAEQVAGSATGAAATGDQSTSASAAAGGNTQLPQGWPDTLPVYPNSEIVAAYTSGEGANQVFAVNLNTSATPEMVMEFYREKALAAGYSQVNAVNGEEDAFAHYTSDSWNFNVTCKASKGTTGVMLALGGTGTDNGGGGKSAAEGGESSGEAQAGDSGESAGGESTQSGAAAQTGGALAEILKEYPQGQVDNSVTRGTEHLLTQRTPDSPDAVVQYYTDYYAGLGWVLQTSVDSDAGKMRTFTGPAGQVTLNANPRDGGAFITLNYREQ